MTRRRRRAASLVALVATVLLTPASHARAASARTAPAVLVVEADDAIGFALDRSTGTLHVVEESGHLAPLVDGGLGPDVLDLSADVSDGNEQGLLGAAFSNDGRWLYTDHTNVDGDTEITAWPMVDGVADPSRRRLLLQVDQPYANHNGGHLILDSSNTLWIGLGDGGSGGDPQHNGQNLRTLLGKILRIVPTPSAAKPYSIPTGNLPASKGRPEIWAYGVRNPWRFDLDETRNRVWIADVGQDTWEEIDVVARTASTPNFGWSAREGRHAFKGGAKPKGAIDPIYEYRHGSGGCSITGGVVDANGDYLFSDFCSGRLQRITAAGKVSSASPTKLDSVSGFGRDAQGGIYVAARDSGVYRLG